jgi:hypothetical protein
MRNATIFSVRMQGLELNTQLDETLASSGEFVLYRCGEIPSFLNLRPAYHKQHTVCALRRPHASTCIWAQ